jgi:hypothetical protein
MILLFLGNWRHTLVIAVSIPLSILAAIVILSALGETINIMTLGGLALLGYAELFSQMASYGFIVIGTYSCGLGCVDAHKLSNARWLCGGLPPLAPLNMGWDAYYAEGAKTGARRARTPVKSPLPSHTPLLAPPPPFQPSRSLTGPKTTALTPQIHCSP